MQFLWCGLKLSMTNETNNQAVITTKEKTAEQKKEEIKKKKAKAETQRFKSKYFEYYDDIKISDRQDW